ncbi:hypothetical protein ABMA28_017077 [Loxostege sticticalis]|uniref:Retrotransposon gag domain-containing protein n=1 Tax=Loxostege sticticalis TaxID=481309 RepID=A0ABD0T9U0_LOXSC
MMLWAEPTPAPAGGSRPAAIACDRHTLFDHRNDDNKKQLDNCISQYRSYSELFKSVQDKGTDLLISPGCTESTSSTPPMNITVTCDRGSSTDLGRLKYDGKSCVRSFIQRFTEFCDARSISEAKALSFATEVFTGDALHWYRSVKDRISNWSELINLLRQDFDQLDYDYRLLSEIRARTQGESENITIYLSIMSGLFSRLARTLTDDDKLEIILHNIRPCYASTLASANEIKSLDSLQALCRNYETIQARLANFHEPSAATPNTLAPEFAYNGNKNNIIEQFKEISFERRGLGQTTLITHRIDTGDAQPIRQRYYRMKCWLSMWSSLAKVLGLRRFYWFLRKMASQDFALIVAS